eukprot:symbB.v1.2.004972.t4/scaffold288.1/size478366/2
MKRQSSPPDRPEMKRSSGLGAILRSIQTGRFINTMWADEGTMLCNVQMAMVRLFMIWPLKAVTPVAYLYWAWRLIRTLSGKSSRRVRPDGAMGLLRAAASWGLQELLSLMLGLEVLFFCYYRYKRAMLQEEPALPPRMAEGKPFCSLLTCECRWQSATHVLSSLVDSDLEATVVNHNIVLSRFEKVSHWQPSLNLLHEMQCSWVEPTELERSALQRNVISCNAAVSACEKQGQWWQAMQMLDAMLRVGLQVRLVLLSFVQVDSEVEMFREDDTISNNALISSCEKGGLWEQSLNMLVTVVTCSAAISACATAACWQAALHVFYELLALEQSGLVPNSVTFNAAIIACEKGHRWENALNLMHEMHLRRLELDLITCNAVVNTCSYGRQGWDSIGQTSEWQTAIKLLTDFQQQHVERDVITVEAAMKSFEHAGLGEYADVLRRVFEATQDIQACGRLVGSRSHEMLAPHLSPQASVQDFQEALHPKRNESNVEQLLREWDSLNRVTSQNLAPAVMMGEKAGSTGWRGTLHVCWRTDRSEPPWKTRWTTQNFWR